MVLLLVTTGIVVCMYLYKKKKLCFSGGQHKNKEGPLNPQHEVPGESVHYKVWQTYHVKVVIHACV